MKMEKIVVVEDGYYYVFGSGEYVLGVKDGENILYKRYTGETYDIVLSDFLLTPQLAQRLLKADIENITVNY